MSQWINVEVNDTYEPMFSSTYEYFSGTGVINFNLRIIGFESPLRP